MLQVFYLDVAYVAMGYTHMFSVSFVFSLMLQVFQLDVSKVDLESPCRSGEAGMGRCARLDVWPHVDECAGGRVRRVGRTGEQTLYTKHGLGNDNIVSGRRGTGVRTYAFIHPGAKSSLF
jgi:hypothetical protein